MRRSELVFLFQKLHEYESYSSSSKENKIYYKVHPCSICTIKLHHTIHTSFL